MKAPVSTESVNEKSPEQAEGPSHSAVERRIAPDLYSDITFLQRTAGNRAVVELLQSAIESPQPVNGLPNIVQSELNGGSGQPLNAATRVEMESRFGHDFSGVRVHVGTRAAESARGVN